MHNQMKTMSEDIRYRNFEGSAKSMSGDIELIDSEGGSFGTMSGNVDLTNTRFMDAKSMSGNIFLDKCTGTHVTTMSGNVIIKNSDIDIVESQSGSVTISNSKVNHLTTTNLTNISSGHIHAIHIPSCDDHTQIIINGRRVTSENTILTIPEGLDVDEVYTDGIVRAHKMIRIIGNGKLELI